MKHGCDRKDHLCFHPDETEECCDDDYSPSKQIASFPGYGNTGGNCDVRVGRDSDTGEHGVKIHKRIRFNQLEGRCTKIKLVFYYDEDRHEDLPDLNEDEEDFKPLEVIFKKSYKLGKWTKTKCSIVVVPGLGCDHTCYDNIQNQGETGVDCGGPCPRCRKVRTCQHYFNHCLFDPYKFLDQDSFNGLALDFFNKFNAPKCPEGFSPIPEEEWGNIECTPPTKWKDGDCQEKCCLEDLDIPDCPEDYCPTQHAHSETTEVCLDPADFTTEPCDEEIPVCDVSTQESSQTNDPSVTGENNPFFNGATLPAGTYEATWHDGCMKYNDGQWWTVNAHTSSFLWWVRDEDDLKINRLPGTVGFQPGTGCPAGSPTCSGYWNGYFTYDECITANQNAGEAEVFILNTASKLYSWLEDSPYSDNVSGSSIGETGPLWTLKWVGTCESFQEALANLPPDGE